MNGFERLLALVEEQTLSRSLPTALRVATAISDEEWASWIRLELIGYFADNPAMKVDTIVPEYREVPGLWYDDYGRVLALKNTDIAFINELRLRCGVPELERIATGTGTMAMRPTEFSETLRNNLNVEVSVFRFQPSSVNQVLMNIKIRLLDHLARRDGRISTIPNVQVSHDTELLQLKPNFYGIGIDLKAMWRRVFRHSQERSSKVDSV